MGRKKRLGGPKERFIGQAGRVAGVRKEGLRVRKEGLWVRKEGLRGSEKRIVKVLAHTDSTVIQMKKRGTQKEK